jgi:hypothetical protein
MGRRQKNMVGKVILPDSVISLKIMHWQNVSRAHTTGKPINVLEAMLRPSSHIITCAYDPITGANFLSFFSNYIERKTPRESLYVAFKTFNSIWNYPTRISWECLLAEELDDMLVRLLKLSGGYLYVTNDDDRSPKFTGQGYNGCEPKGPFNDRIFYKIHYKSISRFWYRELLDKINMT